MSGFLGGQHPEQAAPPNREMEDMNERGDQQPLIIRNLSRNLNGDESAGDPVFSSRDSVRVLGTFAGVFVPVALSQFSTTVFLRLGFVVGQSGIGLAVLQFLMAYAILVLTVLSICAISTNGAVEGGGAYYMISRALGPEFGGSIGLLFFMAQVFSCALYITGVVEGLVDIFGSGGIANLQPGMDVHRWSLYAYDTAVLAVCLGICMIGAGMFAKTSTAILAIMNVCMAMVIISAFVKGEQDVEVPCSNTYLYSRLNYTCQGNSTLKFKYTGLSSATFKSNVNANYTVDYSQYQGDSNDSKIQMTFPTVFAVLFSGVTGIMNGANMSGELKNPSYSLPRGTLLAVLYTFCSYITLAFLSTGTASRELLQNNYNYMEPVNLWPPFVLIGIFATTLSAALGNLIGGSRILFALAKDDLFWIFTRPARITSSSGNPWVSLLITWFLVQAVLLIGSMNAIAPITSIFFLMSYASTNLACLALELTSAPNFRPTFRFYSWHTCAIGLTSCLVMIFFISWDDALIALGLMVIIAVVLYFRSLTTGWGSISQALIFHQVRKYLLMLDSRKEHVKFWRPHMLLLVANPRASYALIDFVNDLKKSGLYVLGHVHVGALDSFERDPAAIEANQWLSFVDYVKVKAFVEVTIAPSVREGMYQLVRLSGLGGMKPNTICLGFYDQHPPVDTLAMYGNTSKKRWRGFGNYGTTDSLPANAFVDVRPEDSAHHVSEDEYVLMISDIVRKLQKNICLFRHFHKFNRDIITREETTYVDLWPVNMFQPGSAMFIDNCALYLLQLACVLSMVPKWQKHTKLRVFLCLTDLSTDVAKRSSKLKTILHQFRISAKIETVDCSQVVKMHYPSNLKTWIPGEDQEIRKLPDAYLKGMNELILRQSDRTSVAFLCLPLPPKESTTVVAGTGSSSHGADWSSTEASLSSTYLHQLSLLTDNLPPTVLVHGLSPVISTTL